MARRLPPLTALRAFEAAARRCSFTHAATELHVTQAAISHQVKQLEEWLDLKLFDRYGHHLVLTTEGKNYLADLSAIFDALAAATDKLTGDTLAGALRITVLPSFASKWLVPRLAKFREAQPEIDLHITSSLVSESFSDGKFDLAIRLGLGRWPGLRADLIAPEYLSPVCSPQLLAGPQPLLIPADLSRHTLLHDQPRDHWPRWIEMAGLHDVGANNGPAFSDSALVLQAAIDAHGVALGRLFLAADDIASGRLIKPFPLNLPNDYSYWLVYPRASESNPRLCAFRDWLLDETACFRNAGE